MITLLIGHRGTGKTNFLKRLAEHGGVTALDLDLELEKHHGKSVIELLAEGEPQFRTKERGRLLALLAQAQGRTVIAVGAGFAGPFPEGVNVLWLRRESDAGGRCFLNRPRLDPALSPWDEYLQRYSVRHERFTTAAAEELFLPEGYEGGLEDFLLNDTWRVPFDLTLLPENFRKWEAFLRKRLSWDIRRWEIRDDLLSPEQINLAVASLPHAKILYSRRTSEGTLPRDLACDWPLELGEPPSAVDIVSLHERAEDFASTLRSLNGRHEILKLAVEVKDFSELKAGHAWWRQDKKRRSFLPRSTDGRWQWYRTLFGPQMPVHFFREGSGSSLDQPLLWQMLLQPRMHDTFGAVLGQPVQHSRSPMEHLQFSKSAQMPFVAVNVPEEDFAVALEFLLGLGLRFAAVTAPLKKVAWAHAHKLTAEARQTQSTNTLYIENGTIMGHNTDVLALKELSLAHKSLSTVWLWGGGGVASSVQAAWPQVVKIPARTGEAPAGQPDLLIWATGRGRKFKWPPAGLKPRLVLDLNYSDNSPGLEWAVSENLPYQSGLTMFKLQAELQRVFWRDYL